MSLFALAKTTANVGEESLHTSQMLGLSVTALQELQYAADIAGISQDEVEMSIRQLANGAQDAARGVGTFAKAYATLGISPSVNGKLKQTDQILMEMAGKFSKMPDSLEKTALANDIFGRSGMRLIPFLNKGPAGIAALREEAESLGVVLNEQAAKQSEQFNIGLKRLWASITGIKNQIGVGLMPVITDLVSDMKDWIMANRELVKSTLQEYIKGTIALLKTLYAYAKSGVEAIKGLAGAFGGLSKVVKDITVALAILIALKLVYSIGLIVQGVYTLAASFIALGAAAQIAAIQSAALAAIPLAIGAGVIALLLILEDLWRYSRGDKSVFGLFMEGAKKVFPKILEPLKKIVDDFKAQFVGVKDFLTGLFTLDIKRIKSELDETYQAFKKTIGDIVGESLPQQVATFEKPNEGFFGASFGGFQNWLGNAQKLTSFNPSFVPSSTTNNRTVNAPANVVMNHNTTINASGASAQDIASQVVPVIRRETKDVIGEMLRQGYTPSGEEY